MSFINLRVYKILSFFSKVTHGKCTYKPLLHGLKTTSKGLKIVFWNINDR